MRNEEYKFIFTVKNPSKKTYNILIAIILEIVVLILAHIFIIKDIGVIACLTVYVGIVDYLIFSTFEHYAAARFAHQKLLKLLISAAVTILFYIGVLVTLSANEIGLGEMTSSEIMINLLPGTLFSIAALINFMSNSLKFFIIKTSSFYVLSISVIIANHFINNYFLGDVIIFVLLFVQILSAVILSIARKE